MRKYKIQKPAILLLLSMFCIASCYDDKSTLATSSIPEVQINIADENQKNTIKVGYQVPVDIVPTITQAGTDGSKLLYEWAITEGTSSSKPVYEVIGTEKEYHDIINRPISSASYTLKLTVTDAANDNLQYTYTWDVYVQSSFLDGLLVADSENGSATDLTLINSSQLTHNYVKEEKIFRHILKTANGSSYNGLLTSLTYETRGNAAILASPILHQVWGISSMGESIRFDCEDYSINGTWESENIFLYRPEGFQIKTYVRSSQLFIAITNNGIYSFINTIGNKFSMPNSVFNGYEINNNVYAANSSYHVSDNHFVWLDKPKKAFYALNGTSFNTCTTYAPNSEFDPGAMTGKSAIAATSSQDGSLATFLLKEDNSGEYIIYTLNQYRAEKGIYEDPEDMESWIITSPEVPASAKNKFTIPLAGKTLLDKAVSIFFGHTNNVLYVVTDTGVYAFTYGMGSEAVVSTVSQFTPAAGEKITKAKLYQQGQYTNQINVMTGNPPVIAPNSWNNKALIIVTQSGEFNGKVSIVPMKQPGAGTLDTSNTKTYDGFGKVLDVITTGY